MSKLPLVSVLVVGYSRPDHLERTVRSFLTTSRYPNLELILADDGSPPELLARMKQLPFDRVVTAERNSGLGANANRGLAATRGEYVLQLQDDWVCLGPADFLEAAVAVASEDPELQFIRLTNREPSFPGARRTVAGKQAKVFRPSRDAPEEFLYTDTPHLKSRRLVDQLGPYLESRYMQRTEIDMRDRFSRQGHSAVLLEGYAVFEHIGEGVSFNRPLPLARLGGAMDQLPVLRHFARAYRSVRSRLRKRGRQ